MKRVVYSALIGGYENLAEQPMANGSDIDFVCFTDRDDLTSDTWNLVTIIPKYCDDRVRSARHLKVLGHEMIDVYDESMWIDNRVVLRRDPAGFFDEHLDGAAMAAPKHDFRRSVRGEFLAVIESGYDDPMRVRNQLGAYETSGVLEERPYWTGILLRKNLPQVDEAMREWMDQILLRSRRDQLSLNFAAKSAGLEIRSIDLTNAASDWHEWSRREQVGRRESDARWSQESTSVLVGVGDALRKSKFGRGMLRTLSRVGIRWPLA